MLVISCLFFYINCFSQPPGLAWAKHIGGISYDRGEEIGVDNSSNVYTAGTYQNSVDFDPGVGVNILNSTNWSNVFVTKLDHVGNFLWAKGFAAESLFSMTIDSSGNVYITGGFRGTVDFDPGPGVFNMICNSQLPYWYICKLNSNGDFLWAKNITTCTYGGSTTVDSRGFIYTIGNFGGTVDFDPGPGIYNLTTPHLSIFISKLDPEGQIIWAKSFNSDGNGSSGNSGRSISVDKYGYIYTTGEFEGTIDFDPGIGVYILSAVAPHPTSTFVSKLDGNGNFKWAKNYLQSFGLVLTVDKQSNVYTSGYFEFTTDFDPGVGIYNLTAGNTDLFITKLDINGNFIWAKQMGSNSSCNLKIFSIVLDSLNNVYTTGLFTGPVDFDPGVNAYILNSSGGIGDIFLNKLDSLGNFVWVKKMGGIDDDIGTDITLDALGNIYATGYFNATANFDSATGTNFTANGSYDDIYIVKLGSNAALPVHLLTFTAQLKENKALLNWQVANEQNFDRYQIERSPNGKDFITLGAVKADNKKEYSYTDKVSSELAVVSNQNSQLPTNNSLYYRLKMIDRDGSFTYSPIRQINIKHSTFNIFPNPAHNIVTITGDKLKTITLTDNAGRTVLTKVAENDKTIEIFVGHLPKGLYLLTLTTTSGNTQSEKLIIE